ncbi:MAG: hypothetical protein HY241_10510 [Actinobacteria bacterium]|nr:hypothetical protein [Actinomycetota bacterium]
MTSYSEIRRKMGSSDGGTAVRSWAADVLADVMVGRRPAVAVHHPLGFLCLPVDRSADGGVCIHLWSAEFAAVRLTTTAIHCHSWDLLSFVLLGQVRNEVFDVADEPVRPSWRVYEVRSSGDVDEIVATPQLVSGRSASVQDHRAGRAYELRAGDFHTTTVPGGHEAATVVLARTRPGLADRSLGPVDGHTHRVRRQSCNAEVTVRAASTVLERIASG